MHPVELSYNNVTLKSVKTSTTHQNKRNQNEMPKLTKLMPLQLADCTNPLSVVLSQSLVDLKATWQLQIVITIGISGVQFDE